MPAPTNTTIETAYDLGSVLPVTYVQQADFGGTTFDLWFKLRVPSGVVEIGPWAYGNFGTWNPKMTCWNGPVDDPVQIGGDVQSRPMQIPVTAGEFVYFRTFKFGGNVSPAVTTIDILEAPQDTVPTGSILYNDEHEGMPWVGMSTTTGDTLAFYPNRSVGNNCRVLVTGDVMATDTTSGEIRIYQGVTLRSTPTMPAAGYSVIGTDQTTGWWVCKPGTLAVHPVIVFVAQDGTVDNTTYDCGAGTTNSGLAALSPNLANDKVYLIKNRVNSNQPVLVITIPGAVVSTFIAGVASYLIRDVVTMLDDTVLVAYVKSDFTVNEVRRFDTAGVLTNTYSLGDDQNVIHNGGIFPAIDDPNSFWVQTQDSDNKTNRFRNIKVSDGSVLHDLTNYEFINGVAQNDLSASPPARFGSDNSCQAWIGRASILTTETFPIRRQRRFLLPSSPDNKNMQIPVIELLMRTGIGLTEGPPDAPVQGSDPQVMIRLSKDGGKTWGNERWLSAGKIGQYVRRVRLLRATGNYRNAVLEVTVSDPVDWQFLAALAPNGILEGSS